MIASGSTEVHMWLKYCSLIGHNSYELLMIFTRIVTVNLIELDSRVSFPWGTYVDLHPDQNGLRIAIISIF